MFAASLGSFLLVGKRIEKIDDPETGHKALIDTLCNLANISPLARLASIADLVGSQTQEVIISVIKDYDQILMLLGKRGTRAKLKSGSADDTTSKRIQELADKVQVNLELIFFEDDLLSGLTRRYSLF